jgi:hypothetical protein
MKTDQHPAACPGYVPEFEFAVTVKPRVWLPVEGRLSANLSEWRYAWDLQGAHRFYAAKYFGSNFQLGIFGRRFRHYPLVNTSVPSDQPGRYRIESRRDKVIDWYCNTLALV